MTQMLQLSVIQIDAMYKYLHTIDPGINSCIVLGNARQCNIYMMHVQTLITQWVAMLVCLLGIIVSTLADTINCINTNVEVFIRSAIGTAEFVAVNMCI